MASHPASASDKASADLSGAGVDVGLGLPTLLPFTRGPHVGCIPAARPAAVEDTTPCCPCPHCCWVTGGVLPLRCGTPEGEAAGQSPKPPPCTWTPPCPPRGCIQQQGVTLHPHALYPLDKLPWLCVTPCPGPMHCSGLAAPPAPVPLTPTL